MTALGPIDKVFHSKKGQSLIELTLITPLMLFLIYGVVEVGSIIGAYLTLSQLTREGANMTSRGTIPQDALDAITAAGAPTIRNNNQAQWRIIYTRFIQAPTIPCPPPQPCTYIIDNQIIRGNLGQSSKIGGMGNTVTIPGIQNVGPSQKFHTIEVFYDYGPNALSFVANNVNKIFYERTIFTDVSGKP